MIKRLSKIKNLWNNKNEITSIWFDFSTITKNIKLNINQKKYIEYSFKFFNEYWVNKLTFDDLFKILIFKNAYDKSEKDTEWYMIYTWKEFKDEYQLLKLLWKVDASKYKKWWLLESSSDEKYKWRGTYRFTDFWKKFMNDVLNNK